MTQKTARITVDNNTRTSHAVTCNQVQWLLTANITAAPANVRVLLKLDSEKPKLESVNIDNFAGFTGVADVGAGDAKAVFADDTIHHHGHGRGISAQRSTRLTDGTIQDRGELLNVRSTSTRR